MKNNHIKIISALLLIFLINSIYALENSLTEETKNYPDVFYPPEDVLAKQGMTLESYKQSLVDTAPKNRNSSVDNIWGTCPLTGNINIPVLLVDFQEDYIYDLSDISLKFNDPNYLNGAGISVSKYYTKQSYGDLNVNFFLYGWETLPHDKSYYSANDSRLYELMIDTMALFNSDVNFANYDNDGNGRIDGVVIVFAGSQGTPPSGIPLHTRINKSDNNDTQFNNKLLGNVAIVPEMYKYSNTDHFDYIDGIVHEFAHVLGLPDLYANSNNGGIITQINRGPMPDMSMMTSDHQSHNVCRKKPSNLDAWSRYFFGWTDPEVLTTESNKQISLISANDFPDAVILKNNDNMTNREFFIIENRHRNTSDPNNLDNCMFNTSSPNTGGFAIYHVDENKIEYDYPNNTVNWDRDLNYYDDTLHHPGILYEKNKVSSLSNFYTAAEDFYYINTTYPERKYFDENLHIASVDIWDMTTITYSGVENPFIRFEALSLTNQPTMIAKMLVGQETVTPTVSPTSGTYINPISVILETPTTEATIYYTLDGSTPTTSSTVYTTPITISQTTTLKAIANKDGFYVSDVLTANYTVNSTVATPTSNYESGNYIYNTQIILSTITPQASIYYTIDGSDPDQNSTLYQSPIVIDHNFTLNAIAYRDGYLPSTVSTYNYTTIIPSTKILNITFLEAEIINKIEYRDNIYLLVPHNVNRRLLTPIITTEQGTTTNPESGITQDFTIPKQYTVTSPIGSRTYTIYVF
ncbi:MAG: chitobiase/beta-hexosaminidase C-terminal domain-containing protein, partial [Bacteroidales bacterium]